jgi:hypothetical protein
VSVLEASIPVGPRRSLTVVDETSWLVLKESDVSGGFSFRDGFGRSGLWRSVSLGPGRFERIFEIPRAILGVDPDHDLEAEVIDWAVATAYESRPDAVELPTPEEIDAWVPLERRRIRAGSHVAQVEVICEPGRVALAVPALVRIPPGLPDERFDWLVSLCKDIEHRWRLVRIGVDDEDTRVRMEVDLTGAPAAAASLLFEHALTALQASAAWALPGLALVADLAVESQTLARQPG